MRVLSSSSESKHARVELHLRGQHLERGIVTAQDLGRGHLRVRNNTKEAPIALCRGIIMQGQLMKVPSNFAPQRPCVSSAVPCPKSHPTSSSCPISRRARPLRSSLRGRMRTRWESLSKPRRRGGGGVRVLGLAVDVQHQMGGRRQAVRGGEVPRVPS